MEIFFVSELHLPAYPHVASWHLFRQAEHASRAVWVTASGLNSRQDGVIGTLAANDAFGSSANLSSPQNRPICA